MRFTKKDMIYLHYRQNCDIRSRNDWKYFLAFMGVALVIVLTLKDIGIYIVVFCTIIAGIRVLRRNRRWGQEDGEIGAQWFDELPENLKSYE